MHSISLIRRVGFLRQVLVIFAVSISSICNSQVIGTEAARAIAERFISPAGGNHSKRKAPLLRKELESPVTLSVDGKPAVYVFNITGGGYIIVSGEEGSSRQVLGWSDTGRYDEKNMPVQMADIINSYVKGIGLMRKSSPEEQKLMETHIAKDRVVHKARNAQRADVPAQVDPLLGKIEWSQDTPYNDMCPVVDTYNGPRHCVTGCVATAVAQVMKYYEWPKQGRGSYSYTWRYNGEQTLSVDYSQSVYRWDKMLPTYSYYHMDTYTQEEKEAVALLMRDVGYALNMNYSPGSSGANLMNRIPNLIDFFDYDRDMRMMGLENSTVDDWEAVMRLELAAGRPVFVNGDPYEIGMPGHQFVCDGYDEDGLFHYNFGWNGSDNGWYASTATGYDRYPFINYGFQPNKGGKGALSLHLTDDFMCDDNGNLKLNGIGIRCNAKREGFEPGEVDVAIALQNAETGHVDYYTIDFDMNFGTSTYYFDQNVADGKYYVYPVARINGGEWGIFFHNAKIQSVVDLTVTNGEKKWENNNFIDYLDDGVIEYDGMYYLVIPYMEKVILTKRNKRGACYSGDVIIPDYIVYEGKRWPVNAIGQWPFAYCDNISLLQIGRNIETIPLGTYFDESVHAITFAEGSRLKTIDLSGFAHISCEDLILPDGLETIGDHGFYSASIKNLSIPASVRELGAEIFCYATIDTLRVNWTSLDNITIQPNTFDCFEKSQLTLIVPKGYADIYRQSPVWGDFKIIEDSTTPEPKSSVFDASTGTLTIKGEGNVKFGFDGARWSDIKHVVVEEGVTSIPDEAFYNCVNIESISLPSTLKEIGYWAFRGCENLHEIDIPEGVKEIRYGAFEKTDLKSITVHWTSPADVTTEEHILDVADVYTAIVHVPEGCREAYKNHAPWNTFTIYEEGYTPKAPTWTYENHVLTIQGDGDMPFSTAAESWSEEIRNEATKVVVGEGITTLATSAFESFQSLAEVELPSTLRKIGDRAFNHSWRLKHLVLPEGLQYIGYYAFDQTGLETIVIPSTVKHIGFSILYGTNLIAMYWNLTSFDGVYFDSSFLYGVVDDETILVVPEGCAELYRTSVPWSEHNFRIKEGNYVPVERSWSFDEATGTLTVRGDGKMIFGRDDWAHLRSEIKHIVLEEGVTLIGEMAFQDCSMAETLSLPSTLYYIDQWAFRNCSKLKTAAINDKVSFIGWHAFAYCNLDKVVMPKNLQRLAKNAFQNSTIGTIYAPWKSPGKIDADYDAFNGVDKSKTTLVVPEGCTGNYSSVEPWAGFIITEGSIDDAISVVEVDKQADSIYNINGSKVSQMQPGHIYIINGKKVLCK